MNDDRTKFLVISGSPRKQGNTDTLIAAVASGIEQCGGQVEIVRIADLNVGPCIACGGCTKTGRCVIEDDMHVQGVYDKVLTTQNVILASPIYFYAISAQLKMFIDRMQAMWSRKQLLAAQGKWQVSPDKKGYFLSVAATRGPKIFDGSKMCVQYAYDAMGFNYSGEFFVRGVDKRSDLSRDSAKLEEATAFGRSIMPCET